MNSYGSLSDDFGVSVYLASKAEMPSGRETVLHFFEAIQKQFPKMTDFERRDDKEYALEEDRDSGSYRWVTLDNRRLCSGFVNPPSLEDADQQNERVLEMAPYHLGVSGLDADTLDLVMGVLDELRAGGRVVGIVSHVDEMRQRIPSRLHVLRGRTGSTLEMIAG